MTLLATWSWYWLSLKGVMSLRGIFTMRRRSVFDIFFDWLWGLEKPLMWLEQC